MAKAKTNQLGVRGDRRVLLALLVPIVLSAATWFLFTDKQMQARSESAQTLASAEQTLATKRDKIAGIRDGRATAATEMLERAQVLGRMLPQSATGLEVMTEFETLTRQLGISITSSTQNAVVTSVQDPTLTAQTFTITVSGQASSLQSMFSALQRYPQLVTVADPKIDFAEGETTATFQLYAWSYGAPTVDAMPVTPDPAAVPVDQATGAPAPPASPDGQVVPGTDPAGAGLPTP